MGISCVKSSPLESPTTMSISYRFDKVDNLKVREPTAEVQSRSLPATPAPATSTVQQQQQPLDCAGLTPSRPVSGASRDEQDYTDITESLEEPPPVEKRRLSDFREIVHSAGKEELKRMAMDVLEAFVNGLEACQRQSSNNRPGVFASETASGSACWSCHATHDGISNTVSTISDNELGVDSKADCPYKMNVQNVYNISNHGTMYFPGAAQGMQCGDYNDMSYMSLRRSDRRNADDDDENSDLADYEHLDADFNVIHRQE